MIDATVIGLRSRNRSAADHLEAAAIAIDELEDEIAAAILLATAAELVDDVESSPYRRAADLEGDAIATDAAPKYEVTD